MAKCEEYFTQVFDSKTNIDNDVIDTWNIFLEWSARSCVSKDKRNSWDRFYRRWGGECDVAFVKR